MKEKDYKVKTKIVVNDKFQKGYSYILKEKIGEEALDFHQKDFFPQLTPQEMLNYGIFEGKYLNDCQEEFPEEWFETSKKRRANKANDLLNFFQVKSRLSLKEWKKRKWITKEDPRGWFQWYCRYFLGRRTEGDEKQIKRWKSFKRHYFQLKKNCSPKNLNCRRKQRQALLQWAYDPFV